MGGRLIPGLGDGAPELLVPSPETSMMRRLACHFDLVKCAIAKSMAALIEVRPINERGAARIAAAMLPASSSSRISVQSTTTC